MIAYALVGLLSTLTVVIPERYAGWLYLFKWPWYLWAIGLLLIALVGFFETAYRSSHTAFRSGIPVTSEEWKELAVEFDKIAPVVRAEWFSGSFDFNGQAVGEKWTFRDGAIGGSHALRCEALCARAGALLKKSSKLTSLMSERVKTRTNDAWRWLHFLSENHNALKIDTTGRSSASGFTIDTKAGHIESVAAVCSAACNHCAAKEI